jgi:hypothetical protein
MNADQIPACFLPSLLSPHSSLPAIFAAGENGASGTPVKLATAFLNEFRQFSVKLRWAMKDGIPKVLSTQR